MPGSIMESILYSKKRCLRIATWFQDFQSSSHKIGYIAWIYDYRKTSNISRTLVGNKIVDHSDVVGASPVGAAPTTSSFST